MFDESVARRVRIQYGGSVKPGNARELMALVGRALSPCRRTRAGLLEEQEHGLADALSAALPDLHSISRALQIEIRVAAGTPAAARVDFVSSHVV